MLAFGLDVITNVLYCLVSVEEQLYLLRSLDYGRTWVNSLLIDFGSEHYQWELVSQFGRILLLNHQKRHKMLMEKIFPQSFW